MTTPPEDGTGELPPYEVLSSQEPPVTPPRARRRGIVPLIVVIVLLLAGAGGYAAYAKILKPHGAAPEEATPSDAMAFAKVDLDPSPTQKLAVYRLAKRFPKAKVHSNRSVSDDLLRAVFESAGDAVDYDKDIKPWIGKRAAIAAIPDATGGDPHPLIVVQYADKKQATTSLDRLTKKANADTPDDPIYFAMSDVDGYVVLSDTKPATDAAAHVKRHLDQEAAYRHAVQSLHGDQIVTGWADAARVWSAIPKDQIPDNPFFKVSDLNPKGELVLGAHAENDAVELVAHTIGLRTGISAFDGKAAGAGRGSNLVQSFPDDSMAAFSETGLGGALAGLYAQNESTLRDLDPGGVFELLDQAGVRLPADIRTVFGAEVGGFVSGTEDEPRGALRVKTADPARAKSVISRIITAAGGDASALQDVYASTTDGYVVGWPKGVRSAATRGHLGTQKAFRDAVPEADGSPLIVYVDIQKALGFADSDVPDAVRQLKAFGMTGSTTGSDTTVRMRLTFV